MEVYERKTTMAVSLEFQTKPISVNAMYRSFARGRRVASIKSQDYRDFIEAAGEELEAQKPGCVPGHYGIRISLCKGCRLDVDNAAKAFLDLLALYGVTENDRNCQKLEIWRGDHPTTMVQVLSTKGSWDNV